MLKVENLAKTFGGRILYKNVNFELYSQSIHLLAGKNGTGKSTLFKILCGLVEEDAGTIKTDLTLADVGYLAHQSFFYPQLSALENLKFWNNVHSSKTLLEEEYLAILEKVGLGRFAYEKVKIFSRGMQQKLSIARLLAQKPKLYLLDEPSTGLDTEAKAFLIEQILQAKEKNASIFWISHDIEKDIEFADYLHTIEQKALITQKIEKGIICPQEREANNA